MTEIRVGFREPEYFLLCFAFLRAFCALCGETPLRFSIGGTDGIRPHDLPGMTGTRSLLIGGAGGIRTPDLLDAIEARSQLRHGPTGCGNAKKL
jgi:hypothetical protein